MKKKIPKSQQCLNDCIAVSQALAMLAKSEVLAHDDRKKIASEIEALAERLKTYEVFPDDKSALDSPPFKALFDKNGHLSTLVFNNLIFGGWPPEGQCQPVKCPNCGHKFDFSPKNLDLNNK